MLSPPSGTRSARGRRRLLIAGGVVATLALLVVIALFVVYPRVGARMIRSKVGDKLASKLGREVRMGHIEVTFGHAVLHDLEIRGEHDGDTPLIHVDRIDVDFDTLRSFVGSVQLGEAKLDGVVVTIRRDGSGADNVRDVLERLRGGRSVKAGGGEGSLRPTKVTVDRIKVLADDAMTGATGLVGNGRASWSPGELVAVIEDVSATTVNAPKASAQKIEITKKTSQPPTITVTGGELAVYPKLALTGIEGSITANPMKAGQYTLDLSGGYGGVPGTLWTAKGGVDPEAKTGTVDIVAAKFQLDRLAPLLAKSPIVDYKDTSIDTKLTLSFAKGVISFAGDFALGGLNVGHPLIAAQEVHDLDLAGQVEGTFSLATRTLELARGDFHSRGVPFSVTGKARQYSRAEIAKLAELPVDPKQVDQRTGEPVRRVGPARLAELTIHFVIPPIDCQRVLTAIPSEMVPYMQGYKLKGTFDTDLTVAIDWADLDATKLDGGVGIRRCRVVDEPDDSPKRLEKEFEHFVEVEEGQWMSFVVGESNPDFVPLADISPYLIQSIQTTEDGAFYKHKGFIVSEFRTALISNLKAGKFRHGASSITMQFVKNVLLYRDKTLLRKFQELFLTWHVENTLTKDRILEIYFNVIEYGPGLYGIGPASWHYFSKPAKDLNAREAAFFSSILPSPKERYKQYCQNTLTKWSVAKIDRILNLMKTRKRITEDEYNQAMATPLLFAKDDSETEKDCMDRVKKAIKNARPTNPLAPKKDDRKKKDAPKTRRDAEAAAHKDKS
ncbi:MAG: transglycosylase domain-containing protein [Kofleriaceae bacterium]